jgi:hypothetical protein
MTGEREIPNIVSVDDHVVEPPHLFERWLPSSSRIIPTCPAWSGAAWRA